MPAGPTIEQIRDRVRRALEPVPEVRAALVFGSYARRRARPDSDVDVAVLLDPSVRAGDRGELLRKLFAALGSELRSDRLDLVVLDDAPLALAFQALRDGVVAIDRDQITLHRFRVRTYTLHSDYEPVERLSGAPRRDERWDSPSCRAMVDADILRRRIDALLGYLARLEQFRSVERDQFVDPDTHHLAERYLHLGPGQE